MELLTRREHDNITSISYLCSEREIFNIDKIYIEDFINANALSTDDESVLSLSQTTFGDTETVNFHYTDTGDIDMICYSVLTPEGDNLFLQYYNKKYF